MYLAVGVDVPDPTPFPLWPTFDLAFCQVDGLCGLQVDLGLGASSQGSCLVVLDSHLGA